jgi:hypothetical protein
MKNLNDIEEKIDFTAFCLNSQAEDLFSAMLELRHNAPELFQQHLFQWKETYAEITELNQRILTMVNIVNIENRLN